MKKLFLLLTVFTIVISIPATPALQVIGTATYSGGDYKLIYDTHDQLTWLDYSIPATYAFQGALDWAASLNDPGELTINLDPGYTATWGTAQWRLPQAEGNYGYWDNEKYITSSEMGGLYYDELGNELNDATINTGPFDHLVYTAVNASWYFLEPNFSIIINYAPAFNFNNREHYFLTSSVNGGSYGMAVIPGAVLPEPATMTLLALGGMMLRRKK